MALLASKMRKLRFFPAVAAAVEFHNGKEIFYHRFDE